MKPAAVLPRLAIFSLLLGAALCAGAQSTGVPQPAEITTTPNAWMKTPTPMSSQDPVPVPVRALRDQLWDESGFPGSLIKDPMIRYAYVRQGCSFAMQDEPELPPVGNRAILTGTFVGFRSVITKSERMIYTDITFRVHDVLEDKTGRKTAPGPEITISVEGGTITTNSGQEISYVTNPSYDSLQPGHTYLVVLIYHADGDFYYDQQSWDISDGIVRPNSIRSQYFASHGLSTISGLTTAEMLRTVKKQLTQ